MSLIKNLVKETEDKPKKKKKGAGSGDSDSDGKGGPLRPFVKTATDLQRLKLEKLMKHPEKPVIIPEQRRERDYNASVPTFVRNVMGSSAGAGSGEFHVYRHLRRKEYARQKNIQHQSAREAADDAYQQKIDDNRRLAEERTAKKRAKRLKKKQRAKKPREQKTDVAKPESESSGSASEGEEDAEEKPETADPQPETADPKLDSADPKPETTESNPETADPKPEVNIDEVQQRPEEVCCGPPEKVDSQNDAEPEKNET
ncbi:PRKR-interacting protein 1 homolog [Drosophila subobscura]|uniref:PRKR-interacting protein 1 homolog n=1 Tax=Drosophila subobscura TaxID=7241 RepID=UPI00155A7EA3|nr:PRKR-interacting protein 1 homolog [Drosophila subobscura]